MRDQVTQIRQWAGAEGTGTFQDTTMTYDGYGRIKTQHLPEQQIDPNNSASTTYSTLDYNADDTIQKITDPRGAVSTFSYNGRHLVTQISYSLLPGVPTTGPSGVAQTATTTFAYDAAGNRTSMLDGLGNVSYSYNQLSQLITETRYFSALTGSSTGGYYALNYQYNLTGALKSFTDPFGAQVNYNFDVANRVSSVTGSGFGTVSTYASNIQYRAWGDPKSVSYGDNSSATTTYNSRMMPSTYQLTTSPPSMTKLREQFQYYADGTLQKMTDLDDRDPDVGYQDTARYFSRAYRFDHAGRLAGAKGVKPSGQDSDLPFNQTYGYDAFGNMTYRYGTYYYQTGQSDGGTFQNNRRQDFNYAADGQVSYTPAYSWPGGSLASFRDWSYDTAGLLIKLKETVVASGWTSTYITSYDGNGRQVREYLLEDPVNSNSYMVWSSVLDEPITRLDNVGSKLKTIVNVDGMLRAVQYWSGGNPVVSWTHVDPLGLSEAGDKKPVFDPLDNYVPWQAAPGMPPNAYPPFSPSFGGLGAGFGSSQSVACTSDGLPVNCNTGMRLVNNGSAALTSIISHHSPVNFFASLGISVVMEINTRRVRTGKPKPGRPQEPPKLLPPGDREPEPDPGPGGDGDRDPAYFDVTTVSFRLIFPQNPTPEDRARQLLGQQDCANFIAELISLAEPLAVQTGSRITPSFGPLLAGPNGGLTPSYDQYYGLNEYRRAVNEGRVTASGNSGRSGDIITYGTTTNNSTIAWNREFYRLGRDEAARQIIHESLHLIPNFSDFALAGAASIIATRGRNNPGNTGNFANQSAASQYLNQQIARHCR